MDRRARARKWFSHTKVTESMAKKALSDSYVQSTSKAAVDAENNMRQSWFSD